MPNVVSKYIGDGIMLVFDTDDATEAVNAVIRIQEAIAKASTGTGGAKGVIDFACSAGISTGEVVGFTTPGGNLDVVGTVADKAFRLCAAASAKAIFVDTPTLGAANTIRITSSFGKAVGRTSDQYQGDVQRAVLKGLDQPVTYHEILWDQQLYGVKSATVTASADLLRSTSVPRSSARHARADGKAGGGLAERHRGQITCWKPDRDFGFVRDPLTGEDFYFASKAIVYTEDAAKLARGQEVAFVVSSAPEGSKRRHANALLLVGELADGHLSLPHSKPHGWIEVVDTSGHRHPVYVPPSELVGYQVGDVLGFTVGVNDRGAFAKKVELLDDDQAA